MRVLTSAGGAVVSRRTRNGLVYLLLTVPLELVGAVAVLAGGLVGTVLLVTPLGPWLLALVLRAAAGLGAARRATAALLLDERVAAPRGRGISGGLLERRRAALTDPAGWRAVAYLLVRLPAAPLSLAVGAGGYVYGLVMLTLPLQQHRFTPWALTVTQWAFGGLLLLAAPWLLRGVLAVDRALIRGLLGPSRTVERLHELRETRDRAVTDADVTLRRIERDLHDGAQARLVGLGMQLTMVRELLAAQAPPDRVRAAVDTAQGTLTDAVVELRDLVRGIHPPVLDNGLGAALATVAAGSAMPVTVTTDLRRRPPPAVESIVYFCACELITNVARHSAARRATIEVADRDGVLSLRVRDDGAGGAYRRPGGGLVGLAERVRLVDGRLSVDSPPAGPTVVSVEIPYAPEDGGTG